MSSCKTISLDPKLLGEEIERIEDELEQIEKKFNSEEKDSLYLGKAFIILEEP